MRTRQDARSSANGIGLLGVGEGGGDALVERAWRAARAGSAPVDDLEGEGVAALGELDGDAAAATARRDARRSEREIVAVAAQIEVGVAPGVELGGAAQGLAGADVAGALPGVMDDEHGDAVAALQLAQVGEQRRDLAAGVLVDAMQAHEGIEDEQARLQSGDGLGEACCGRRRDRGAGWAR